MRKKESADPFLYKPHQSPCIDCTDREVGCHSVCEKYSAYKKNIKTERTAAFRYSGDKRRAESYRAAQIEKIKKKRS